MPPQYMMVALWFLSGIMYPWEQIGEHILIYARGLWSLFLYRCKIISDSRIRKLLAFNSLHVCRHLHRIFNHIVITDLSHRRWIFRFFILLGAPGTIFSNVFVRSFLSLSTRVACTLYCLMSVRLLLICVTEESISALRRSVAISTCLRFPEIFAEFCLLVPL